MEALRIILDEHQALAALLHALRFMLKEISAGRLEPDLRLLEAMIHYLDAYPEKRHHPKEDFLFERLKARTEEGAAALARLEMQHAGAPARIHALEDAVRAYAADATRLPELVKAFDVYAEFYRNHMLLEESGVLPLARQHLTPDDWVEVDQVFAQDPDPMAGMTAPPEDFAALFSRLVAATPAPLGLGGGPFKG
ncbi:MAG: hemerythrin domain-containing protein [Zoogloeaceae bacterium]|nr:hemerythrin domain-containing protein [Zoogloeaceae bacterium]